MPTPSDRYLDRIGELIADVRGEQDQVRAAAGMIADAIAANGLVHVFGSGHSHMMAEEVFHRAGGLIAFNAMLDINLTHFGTLKAGMVERTEGYAGVILDSFDVRSGEVVIVVSNSGINPVPIDLAIGAKQRGARTIAITSAAAYASATSRHSSGKKLADVCDLTIDSRVPNGDAVLSFEGMDALGAASSTVLGAVVMNMLVAETIQLLLDRGVQPPLIVSQNVPGGMERNRSLMEKYGPRLKLLKD